MAAKIDKSRPGWLARLLVQQEEDRNREIAERAGKYVPKPKKDGQPRYVPLRVWAEIMFGEHAPGINTLRKWMHEGRIYPPPKKIGGRYFVSPDADYME
ncbi:Excisionase-like protein [Caballeronia peredens]|nr:Excisionase-like protein [Caballeronia peredens]